MSDKRFIGFIDILGFKDLVSNNSHQRLVELYEKLFSPGVAIGLARGKIKIIDKGEKKFREPDYSEIKVNSLIVSDSVIVWTDDNSMKSFVDILASIRNLLNHSFVMGFPLRGAIVEGDLKILKGSFSTSKDNSINTLVGLGLVDAYKQEEEQNWSGCTVDDNCINTYNGYVTKFHESHKDLADINYLMEKSILAKFKVPLKTGKVVDKYVVDWVNMNNKDIFQDESRVRSKFSEYNKVTDDWRVEQIIRNTLDFTKKVVK